MSPYIKFSHVMGKYISDISFGPTGDATMVDMSYFNKQNFQKLAGMWYRDTWPKLTHILDEDFGKSFDWRTHINWNENFEDSGRNYVYISLGVMCDIYVHSTNFKKWKVKIPLENRLPA